MYKILRHDLRNRDIQYSIGKNVYAKEFLPNVKASGFYFCKKKDVGHWAKLYANPIVCEVVLCPESIVHKGQRKLKTDRFILQNPMSLREFFSLQTEDTLIDYVYDDGLCLEHIANANQTHDICMFAVRQNGRALQFVKDKTPDIVIEALKQNGRAIQFLEKHDQTKDLCMLAVKQNG